MDGIGGGRGGRGGHMTPKTNFSPGPAIGARARRPCVRHLQCGRRDGEAVTEKRGEERRGTNYSSHELRLRGQKRERDPRPPRWNRKEDILSSEREKERKKDLGGCEVGERARRGNVGIQKSRTTTRRRLGFSRAK